MKLPPALGPASPGRRAALAVREAVGSGGPAGNLLIHGDNLLALRALAPTHGSCASLVYIDPPYNTGQTIAHYVDRLGEEAWLRMMRPRLAALRDLLKPDGLFAVHIDHRELFPLKLLLDEIFDARNFLTMVTLRVKDPAGVGQQSPIFDVCEYLLLYARDLPRLRRRGLFAVPAETPVTQPVRGYRKALVDPGERHLVKTLERPRMGTVRIYRCSGYRIKTFNAATPFAEYVAHRDTMFADYNPGGGSILQLRHEIPAGTLACLEYVPTKGRGAGRPALVYFLNRRILAWLRDTSTADGQGRLLRLGRLTNLWDVPNAQLHAEGGVEFRFGKKPEALLARLIGLATRPGDLVVDAFLGSGTTAAVAHKLARRWIGIESGPQARTHALARLKRVVAGSDPTGITSTASWSGGGSFSYCVLK